MDPIDMLSFKYRPSRTVLAPLSCLRSCPYDPEGGGAVDGNLREPNPLKGTSLGCAVVANFAIIAARTLALRAISVAILGCTRSRSTYC